MTEAEDVREIIYDIASRLFNPTIGLLEKNPNVLLPAHEIAKILRDCLTDFRKAVEVSPRFENWQR